MIPEGEEILLENERLRYSPKILESTNLEIKILSLTGR